MGVFFFDAFGSIQTFRYNGNNGQKSYLGFFLTISFILIMFFYCLYYAKRYINYEDIKVDEETERYQFSQDFILDEDFSFALKTNSILVDKLQDNTYFYIKAFYKKYENYIEVFDEELNIQDCNLQKWNLKNSDFESFKITNELCFNTTGLRLEGNKLFGNYSFVEVNFYLNLIELNYTHNSIIEETLTFHPIEILLKVIETKYNYNKLIQDDSRYLRYKLFNLDYMFRNEAEIYFSKDKLKILEENLLSEVYNELDFFDLKEIDRRIYHPLWAEYLSYFNESSTLRNLKSNKIMRMNEEHHDEEGEEEHDHNHEDEENNKIILQINLHPYDKSMTITYRRKRIIEYLSQLGGLFNFIIIMFSFICNQLNNQYFQYTATMNEFNKLKNSINHSTNQRLCIIEEEKEIEKDEYSKNELIRIRNEKNIINFNLNNNSKISNSSINNSVNFKPLLKLNENSDNLQTKKEKNIKKESEKLNFGLNQIEPSGVGVDSIDNNSLNLNFKSRSKPNLNLNGEFTLHSDKKYLSSGNVRNYNHLSHLNSNKIIKFNKNSILKNRNFVEVFNEIKEEANISKIFDESKIKNLNKEKSTSMVDKKKLKKEEDEKDGRKFKSRDLIMKMFNKVFHEKEIKFSYINFLFLKTIFKLKNPILDYLFSNFECCWKNKIKKELVENVEEYLYYILDIKEYLPLYFGNKFLQKTLSTKEQINCLENLDFVNKMLFL